MITLIKSTHHVGSSFFALQPTAAAMFWRQTGVSTTSCILLHPFRKNWFGLSACMPYMLGPCQWFAFKSICFWPNGLWQIGNMWEKKREKSKTQPGGSRGMWSQRGPRVEITNLPWNSQCLPRDLYCLSWSQKPQNPIRNHSRSKNVGSSWWIPDFFGCDCDMLWPCVKTFLEESCDIHGG